MITLFVLDPVEDYINPQVYIISLEKQIEVEHLAVEASALCKGRYFPVRQMKFEQLLAIHEIKYVRVGGIPCNERNVDWIDDNIPREVI